MTARPRVLILGGTAEAAAFAERLVQTFADRLDVTTSLAGRTSHRRALPGRVRIGGFGGAAGLADYLKAERVAALVDATHPFARDISANAAEAAHATATPRLMLTRSPWAPVPGDRWIDVADIEGAASVVADHGEFERVFLTVGSGGLPPFASLASRFFLVRVAEPPTRPVPSLRDAVLVTDRGPFTIEGEIALLKSHRIAAVVSKNAGGAGTYPKIAAARALDIPVVMVRRPATAAGKVAHTVDDAVAWVAAAVGLNLSDVPSPEDCGAE